MGRDTLTILGGALLAVILGNLAGYGAAVGDLASPTPEDSSTIIGGGSLPPVVTFAPIETLGEIVDPTVGFEASPTPIPVITLGPSPSPTPRQTTRPSAAPSRTPGPTPVPPPPVAGFTCTPVGSLVVSFANTSTGVMSSWLWDLGDGTTSTAQAPPDHTYAAPTAYTVTLEVTGPGGTDTASQSCTPAP